MGLLTWEWWGWGSVYLAGAAQVWLFSRWIGSFSAWAALIYPVPLLFFFGLFGWSAMRSGKTVTWKGREIRAD
jgi:4,4'-diaponeurosporenoate glycosyltransferase